VIDGLKIAIQQFEPDAVIFECSDYLEAGRQATEEDNIDLAILDLQMPGMDGVSGVKQFVANHPGTPALIVSGNYTVSDVSEVLTHGAAGFLPKSLAKPGLVNAIQLVLGGEKFIPADILANLNSPSQAASGSESQSSGGELQNLLTGREAQVLAELIEGLQNKEIARILDIQEDTVKLHVKNIYKIIGTSNRAHAVKIAYDKGRAQR